MKRILVVFNLLILTTHFIFGGGEGEAVPGKKVILYLANTSPANHPVTRGAYEFARLVSEKTNGGITIKVYYSQQTVDNKLLTEQVKLGIIAFACTDLIALAGSMPELGALQLPYLFRDAGHMEKVLNGDVGKKLFTKLETSGLIELSWYDSGARNFYTRKPLKNLTELSGLKIGVSRSPLLIELVEALGAVPVLITGDQFYASLQAGTVDGAEGDWYNYLAQRHFAVAPYLITDEHIRMPQILLTSKKAFQKISATDQELLRQAARESQLYQLELWRKYEKAAEKTVKEKGAMIEACTPDAKSDFGMLLQTFYAKQPTEVRKLAEQIH